VWNRERREQFLNISRCLVLRLYFYCHGHGLGGYLIGLDLILECYYLGLVHASLSSSMHQDSYDNEITISLLDWFYVSQLFQ